MLVIVKDLTDVTGLYVQDIYEGGHTEIHPVYKIESIDGSLALLLLLMFYHYCYYSFSSYS